MPLLAPPYLSPKSSTLTAFFFHFINFILMERYHIKTTPYSTITFLVFADTIFRSFPEWMNKKWNIHTADNDGNKKTDLFLLLLLSKWFKPISNAPYYRGLWLATEQKEQKTTWMMKTSQFIYTIYVYASTLI